MAATVKPSEIDNAEDREESSSRFLQGDPVEPKGMQRTTSWRNPQALQQQGTSSEDDKEGKRKETIRGLLPSFPSSCPLENSTTTDVSISPLQWHQQASPQNGNNKLQAPRMMQNAASEASSYRKEIQRGGWPSELASPEMPVSVLIPGTRPQPPAGAQSGGFASPLPIHFRVANASSGLEVGATMDSQQRQMQNPMQHETRQSASLPSSQAQVGGADAHRATAQLTIFYAGMVHVYDDIPLNKAQAIMLLAGSRNIRSPNRIDLPGRGATAQLFSAPNPHLSPSTSRLPAAHTATAAMAGLPWPILPTLAANTVVPQSPIAKSVDVVKELPQARQASLARFLENRKDRLRMKAPYCIKKEGSSTPPCNKSPSPPCNRLETWSSSPALMVGTSHQNAQATKLKREPNCTSSGSEPNSPTRAPPTPPQQSMAGDIIAGSSVGRDLERKPDSTECHSENLLHQASQENSEAMAVDTS